MSLYPYRVAAQLADVVFLVGGLTARDRMMNAAGPFPRGQPAGTLAESAAGIDLGRGPATLCTQGTTKRARRRLAMTRWSERRSFRAAGPGRAYVPARTGAPCP